MNTKQQLNLQERLDKISRRMNKLNTCINNGTHLAKNQYHRDGDHFWIEEIPCAVCEADKFANWLTKKDKI